MVPTPPTHAAPAASTPDPKPWLLAEAKRAEPPFPTPATAPSSHGATQTEPGLVKPATWGKPADPTRVLYRSQAIAGQMLDALNSDIPGQVRIMVTRPVTDRFHQGHVLIPQHSILLGAQDGKPAFGQTRLAVTIEELHFPDGTIVRLQGGLADRSGALGVRGKVNNHYVKLGIGAVLSAALNIGTRGPFGNTTGFQPTLPQEYARDVGSNFSQVGQSIVDRSLNIPPTITLKAGTAVTIQLTDNVSFATPPTVVK
jgi:type IV secretion system protein VirB10